MSVQLPVRMKEMKDSGETFFIELYVIHLRTDTLYIAATDENITFNGQTYVAVPFERQSITLSMDNIVDSCEISLGDCDENLLGYVIKGFDFRGCMAEIFRIMYPDSLTDPNISQWIFSGTIDEPSFADGVFSCKLKSRFPEIECPNRSYQLACNSEFGDASCGMSLMESNVAVVNASGNYITLEQSFDRNYWKDGVVKIEGEARCIESSEGNKIK